jgi:hypothetical protein
VPQPTIPSTPSFPQYPREIIIGFPTIANSANWKTSPIGPLHTVLTAARQNRGDQSPHTDWSIAVVPSSPSGKDRPGWSCHSQRRCCPSGSESQEFACASVLRGTARWLQTTAAVGARPSSGGIHCGPLTRKWPQLGLHRAFGRLGRASHSGLGQLPFQVGRMLVLKVCVTKTSKW